MFEIILISIIIVFILLIFISKYTNSENKKIYYRAPQTLKEYKRSSKNNRSSKHNNRSNSSSRLHGRQRSTHPLLSTKPIKIVTSNSSSNNSSNNSSIESTNTSSALPPKVRKVLAELQKTSVADISESTIKAVEKGIESLNDPKFKSNRVAQDIKNHKGTFKKFATAARSFINDSNNGETPSDERRKNLVLLKKGVTTLLTAVAGARGPAAIEIFEIGHEIATRHVLPRISNELKKRRERTAAAKAAKTSDTQTTKEKTD